MNLLSPETAWIFMSGSDESRFLDDIAFGVHCLIHRGFTTSNILLLVDQPKGNQFAAAHGLPAGLPIGKTSELKNIILELDEYKKNVVIVVTGHGSEEGIDALPCIRPYEFLSILRSAPFLENALVVLGQCYAGTFNYLEAKYKDPSTNLYKKPEICFVGAADLTSSVSVLSDLTSLTPFNTFSCSKEWLANIFLLYFMFKVAVPQDVDGDGKTTVVDAYKAAGIQTNEELLKQKHSTLQAFQEILVKSTMGQLHNPLLQDLADKAKDDLIAQLATLLTNQNCWILNANYGRVLEL